MELYNITSEIDIQTRQLETKRENCANLADQIHKTDKELTSLEAKIAVLEQKKVLSQKQESVRLQYTDHSAISPFTTVARNILLGLVAVMVIRFIFVFE